MPATKLLSRRMLAQLSALEGGVHEAVAHRNTALRILLASRSATTAIAQREFWLEFFSLDQEYRVAVHRLAQFCIKHRVDLRRDERAGRRGMP